MWNEKSEAPVLWYMIGAAAIGTVFGMLFAPKKGSELREDIGQWGRKGREKGEKLMTNLSEMVPLKVKVAAAVGAVKAGGAEALEVVKENFNLDGRND
jgi:gas vesicle protein